MPIYEYKCSDCLAITEDTRSMSDRDSVMLCKQCGKNAIRITIPSSVGINFVGPGFYKTDNPR